MIYLLRDMSNRSVDGIIISQSSTKQDIEDAIYAAKEIAEECGEYTWNTIIEKLPKDCEIFDAYDNTTVQSIYY